MYTPARALALVGVVAAGLTLAGTPPVVPRRTVHDPAGDASVGALDITRVTARNLPHFVVAKVWFAKSVPGDLVVSIDPQRGQGVRLVSRYRPTGPTDNFVLRGAFADKSPGSGHHVLFCNRFQVTWSADAPQAILRMPSRCLHHKHYAAIRFAAVTENLDRDVTDSAPQRTKASVWVPRR